MDRPVVILSAEMIEAAAKLVPDIKVHRTRTSPVDTLGGALGEFAFAQWFTGSWQNHEVGTNKGRADFQNLVEVKTSVYPFRDNLNLVIREDYGGKYKPLYVQLIIDVASAWEKQIVPGVRAMLCGFATHERATQSPPQPMRMKSGGVTPYRAYTTPIGALTPMTEFHAAFDHAQLSIHP